MFELVLRSPAALVETVSDALVDELAALAVTVEDADAGSAGEQALFGEPGQPAPAAAWPSSTLRALFADDGAATLAAAALAAQPWSGELAMQALQAVPAQDWVRLTQSQFAPVPITPGFWIVPSWHAPPQGATQVIRLDPGLAFGTGTHPSTRMCLRWVAEHARAWPRVLDYGCGSGILAIAAARFGARAVDAVDIDPAAVQATADNARHNGVALVAAAPEAAAGHYALVLANILATPLQVLAPLLAGHVAPGGDLVLSGILERQAEGVAAAYAPFLPLRVAATEDGWALMTGRRGEGSVP